MINQRGFIHLILIILGVILGLFVVFHFILVPKVLLPYLAEHGTVDQKETARDALLNYQSFPDDASCAYNMNIYPMYGDKARCTRLKKVDENYILAATEGNNGNRQIAAGRITWNGFYYFLKGDFDTAMKRFNQAWLLTPDESNVYWNFALLLNKQGKSDLAKTMLDKAGKSSNVNYHGFYCDLVYFTEDSNQTTRFSKDSDFYKDAQALVEGSNQQPSVDDCYVSFAAYYYQSGDYDKAKAEIESARKQGLSKNQEDFVNTLIQKMSQPNSDPLM